MAETETQRSRQEQVRESAAVEETPLPLGRVATVVLVTFTEGFTGSILIPFVVFMVESFGYDKDGRKCKSSISLSTSASPSFMY